MLTPFWVLTAMHDALVKPMPGNLLTPSLAESWKVSPDGRVYEFKLREGLKFHNGDPFTAETALEVGLINRIVPPAEVHALAHRQALRLAAKPLGALVASKRLMKQEQAAPVAARIEEEIAIFGRMLGEPAAKEALTAFMENRRPDFSAL